MFASAASSYGFGIALCVVSMSACSGASDEPSVSPGTSGAAGAAGTPIAVGGAGSSSVGGAGSAGAATSGGSGGAAAGSGGTLGGAGGTSGGSGGTGAPDPNGGAPGGPSSSRHVARAAGRVAGTTQGYWEYLPPHYGNGARYPLLVFWHGIGENGDGGAGQLQNVTANGPPRLVKDNQWPETRPFVLLSPQHLKGDNGPDQVPEDCPKSNEIDSFIRFGVEHYDVDPKRVYLTGLSCGAIGSWNYLADHLDDVVSAAVLVSGDGRAAFTKAGCALARVPLWALHGDQDPIVDAKGSTETLAKIQACLPAPEDAKLTVYPGVAHDAWTRTYDLTAGNDVYAWLLTHRKP